MTTVEEGRVHAERLREEEAFDRRMVDTYRTALQAQRNNYQAALSGSVHVAVGIEVLERLRDRVVKQTGESPDRLWGFPIVPADEGLPTDHISVHTTTTIA